MREFFTRNDRDVTRLTDDAPDWLYDAVKEAHDEELPNEWRFRHCHAIAVAIDEGDSDAFEIAGNLVDIYTPMLIEWLGGNVFRPSYCDQAQREWAISNQDVIELIRSGQEYCLMQMAQILLDAQKENA